MRLDPHGHPLHTRALGVVLAARADGRLAADGSVLDLRKRGFVPVAGDLQGSGIIHHMRLAAVVDPATATLETVRAEQPNVAFEPSAASAGESCRDPIRRIDALAGARLDAGFARRLGAEIGGPRGCSHLLTLGHLLGSTVAWALERDRAAHGPAPGRRGGERVYRRDVILDGHEEPDGTVGLAIQLTDVLFAPAPALAPPMARFAAEIEVRALARIDFARFTVTGLTLAERRRSLADLEHAAWCPRDDVAAGLVGLRAGAGISAALLDRLGSVPDDRPVLDALLMLAPTLVQCAAALSDGWAATAKTSPSLVAMGGLPDSCYMWRRDGALQKLRQQERS